MKIWFMSKNWFVYQCCVLRNRWQPHMNRQPFPWWRCAVKCVCVCKTHHRPCSSCWRIRSRIHIMSKQTYTHTHFLNGGPTNVIALRHHPNEMNDGLTSQSLHYLALPSHYTLNIRHNCMTFNNHQQTATCLYFIRAECLYIHTQGDSVSYINPFTTKSELLKSITAISRSVVK